MNLSREITLLTWSAPAWAWLLLAAGLALTGGALVAHLLRMIGDERAAELELEQYRAELYGCACGDPGDLTRQHDEMGCTLSIYELLADDERWRYDLAEIHADERAIDAWLKAGCPADHVPYALTRYAVAA